MAVKVRQALTYRRLDHDALEAALAKRGWAVVRDVPLAPDNAALLELGGRLGNVYAFKNAHQLLHEGPSVHLVTPRPLPVRDLTGKPMYSSMATDFDLHTDETFKATPTSIVLLHCWRADKSGGGTSLMAASERVAARLEPWALALCYRIPFVWREHQAPIFSTLPGVAWPAVRFSIREISGDAIGEGETDARARALPEIFLAAANTAATRLQLGEGDCLALDNRRVLHGRTAFDPASKRLLKRVWVVRPN